MATKPDKPRLDDEAIADIRARLVAHKTGTESSWSELAGPIGIPQGTLSTFGSNNYAGDNGRIAEAVQRWLDSRADREALPFDLPEPPGFQPTPTSSRMLAQLRWAQRGKLICLTAQPGIGKTTTLEHYRDSAPNVWIATMSPSCAGVQPMQLVLLAAMGDRDAIGSPQQLTRRIIERVQRTQGLIAVDEAQNLSEKALDELRGIHDATGIGIALVGSDDVILRLSAGRNARKLAQLTSRVSMRMMQGEALAGDAETIARAWGVEDDRQLDFLAKIAGKPGAVRNVVKVVELASVMAAGEPLGLEHLRDAWAQLSAHTV